MKVEKTVLRIMNSYCDFPDVISVANRSCVKLFKSIEKSENHPLRSMFEQQQMTKTRSVNIFRPPSFKTRRFHNSFVKFCMRQ